MNASYRGFALVRDRRLSKSFVLPHVALVTFCWALAGYLVIAGADGRRSHAVADLTQYEDTYGTVFNGQSATFPIRNFDTTLGTLLGVETYGRAYINGPIVVNNPTSEIIYPTGNAYPHEHVCVEYTFYLRLALGPIEVVAGGLSDTGGIAFAPGLSTVYAGFNGEFNAGNPGQFLGNSDPGHWSDMFGGSKTIELSAEMDGWGVAWLPLQADFSQVLGDVSVSIRYTYAPTPEPSSLFLAVGGGFGLFSYFRRGRRCLAPPDARR